MAGYIQQDGKLYVGSAGMAASVLVTSANLLAELNGNVTIDTTWETAEARWRTRAVKDRVAYAINAQITVEELEFKASNLALLMTGLASGSQPLYGEATATALFWRITTSTAPANKQFVFEFTRTSDLKKMQIYAPKAQVQNWSPPFALENFTLQNVTWDLTASTSGKLLEYLIAV